MKVKVPLSVVRCLLSKDEKMKITFGMAIFIFHLLMFSSVYFTSSKINTIEYQVYKYSMVQIWFLKFIKSILDVISMMFSSIFNCFKI